ncbi:MAG: FKBP-type peptidyl-prolyl cis-trans isomerase [Candidatus Zixiibacteriota bacterium]
MLLIIGCGQADESEQAAPKQETSETQPAAEVADVGIPEVAGDTVTTESGLRYIDVVVGEGASPEAGNMIAAHYTGWLTDGTKFDSSRDRGQPLEFPVGQGRVIKGWDEGLMSMKVGGRRILIIPPELGYGDRGTPGGPIPPGATLVFDVELVGINTPATP